MLSPIDVLQEGLKKLEDQHRDQKEKLLAIILQEVEPALVLFMQWAHILEMKDMEDSKITLYFVQ